MPKIFTFTKFYVHKIFTKFYGSIKSNDEAFNSKGSDIILC